MATEEGTVLHTKTHVQLRYFKEIQTDSVLLNLNDLEEETRNEITQKEILSPFMVYCMIPVRTLFYHKFTFPTAQ